MKKIYKKAITTSDAESLLNLGKKRKYLLQEKPDVVDKIINIIKNDFDFIINENSYWLIEQHPTGHKYHVDTGSENHMKWCQIGVTILLTDSFTGGETYYADDKNGTNETKVDRSILDICVHTSDEWHMVKPHKGKRIVFLMFI